jgi:TPP-dependent pyruvate/acetoin dehydrogenase alpha subunit
MTPSLLQHYRAMLRIRRIEEALADRYAEQQIRCPMHLCIGQEAIAVGVCAALEPADRMFGNHRAHGHYLAKGGDLNAMFAELYGRTTGCCGGRGGSMHLIDLDIGFMGATPIVGGTVPLAVGAAWAAKLQDKRHISTVFFGDGCLEEGVVHESLNFAALHKLPIVFICENNDFSVYTRLSERQPDRPLVHLAQGHGINAASGDGNDIEAVCALAQHAVQQARNGAGPQFLELKTYRWREHCGPNFDDALHYRSVAEIEAGRATCPVDRLAVKLRQQASDFAQDAQRFEIEIQQEITAAFNFALDSPRPAPETAKDKIYA